MLANLRNYLKYSLGRHYAGLRLYTLKPKNRPLIISAKKDACIEGYPRSANTYTVLLVEQCAGIPIKLAHHMHGSAQLTKAVSLGVPAILVIRNPLDAVTSNLLRDQGTSIPVALKGYIGFHNDLKGIKDKLIIWRFDEIINEPAKHIDTLGEQFPAFDLKADRIDNKAIFEEIDRLDRIYKKKDFHLVATRPTEAKKERKSRLKEEILQNPKFAKLLKEAEDLYQLMIQ